MDPITIGMALANLAPSLIKIFTGSDKAADVAGKVIDVAEAVTGAPTGEAALATIQADPNKLLEFRIAVGAQQESWERMYLEDTQNARARDIELAKAGLRNDRANALAGGAGLLVVACLAVTVWASSMDDYAKGVITLILGRSLGWIEQIFSFEFGTTRANKAKDDTIKNLSGG